MKRWLLVLAACGVLWILKPPAPAWWPLGDGWWLPGGVWTGVTQVASAFIARVMDRFGFAGRWCFHALHDDCRCYGLSDSKLNALYREAVERLGRSRVSVHLARAHLVHGLTAVPGCVVAGPPASSVP